MGDVNVYLHRCYGRFLGDYRVLLADLVEFTDGLADLSDPLGLFP